MLVPCAFLDALALSLQNSATGDRPEHCLLGTEGPPPEAYFRPNSRLMASAAMKSIIVKFLSLALAHYYVTNSSPNTVLKISSNNANPQIIAIDTECLKVTCVVS